MKDVMLTLIGPDATGIVARLAAMVEAHGGNWLDSRMIRMGGYFSGLLRIALPVEALSAFGAEVAAFMRAAGYQHTIQPAELAADAGGGRLARLALSGQDHPGIVHAIFRVFQQAGVNVEELSSGLQAAPWSGTPVFEARASVRVPDSVGLQDLRDRLEALAADLMVEVEFGEG